jgi:DNA-binding response OmpR family regulator
MGTWDGARLAAIRLAMPRILIVDDDLDFCALATAHLQGAGYEVASVGSARAANHVIGASPPDLAIVDGFLSDRDGESWIAQQRRNGNDALPIIFVSAFATYARDFTTRQRLINELGVAHVLPKPLDMSALRRHVGALLHHTSPPSTIAKLAELRRTYRSELPQKVAVIATSIALARSTRSPATIEEARRLAHSLEGSAGSYGFGAVGEAAGRVSQLLATRAPRWQDLDATLADLRRRVEAAA